VFLSGFGFRALSRLRKVSRSWRSQTLRTPVGETNRPRLVSSLATRTSPKAGFSKAIFSYCAVPRMSDTLEKKPWVLWLLHRYDEAEAVARDALEIMPDNELCLGRLVEYETLVPTAYGGGPCVDGPSGDRLSPFPSAG